MSKRTSLLIITPLIRLLILTELSLILRRMVKPLNQIMRTQAAIPLRAILIVRTQFRPVRKQLQTPSFVGRTMVVTAQLRIVLEVLRAFYCLEILKDVLFVDLVLQFCFRLKIKGW